MAEVPPIFGPFPQFKPIDHTISEGISVNLNLKHNGKGSFDTAACI